MKQRLKKWLWKISGADEKFENYDRLVKKLGEEIKYFKDRADLVKVTCNPGRWCEHCEKSYPTDCTVYSSYDGQPAMVKQYGCKLLIPCTDFKDGALEAKKGVADA